MIKHRTIIEAGPGTLRRLCCRTSTVADGESAEIIAAALDAVDDQIALVCERPVTVQSLWAAAMRSVTCARCNGVVVLHPSWWSSSRVGLVTAAAATVAAEAVARPRPWLLTQASGAGTGATAVVEIAERVVVISGAGPQVAVPRCAEPQLVAEQVANAIAGMAAAVVLVDTPSAIAGAAGLAALIVDAARGSDRAVVHIDDVRLTGLAQSIRSGVSGRDAPGEPLSVASAGGARTGARALSGLGAAALVLAATAPAVVGVGRQDASPPKQVKSVPTTFLIEGRVALTVPASWSTQRVVAGPGSARVQLTSPSDPEAALHVTQSAVAEETLGGAAERLRHAIDAEPAGVFVDFNPSGISAGRPAVTYRELRASHQVRWTVLLDGPVRISVGCQSRPGAEDAVRDACEQAVRSAHAVG